MNDTFDDTVTNICGELADVARNHPAADASPVSVRSRLTAYRTVLRRYLAAIAERHGHGASGIETAHRLSDVTDGFVRHAFRLIFPSGTADGLALVALGGYGRRELNPHSDVDILCLVRRNPPGGYIGGITDRKIGDILQFLWDMNFDLGHSTRSPGECVQAAEADDYFATSLIDRRFICGDDTLEAELDDRFHRFLRGGTDERLAIIKIDERRQRLSSFHDTVQLQAPNVKECPGALRDIHVTRWLLKLSGDGGDFGRLSDNGVITVREAAFYRESLDFFLRLRHTLHFLAGKRSDVLDHLVLPDAARGMGYAGEGRHPVERLMHDYYMRAGKVRRLTDRFVRKLLEDCNDSCSPESCVEAAHGILVCGNDVRIGPDDADVFCVKPRLLVDVYAVAGARGLPLSCDTASRIEHALESCPADLPEREDVRTAFHDLLTMGTGVSRSLRLMHETGALVKLIPEFDEISWHYQYDFYHTYTTDEHSIRVVENLESMATSSEAAEPDLRDIMRDVTAKNALYLAGLLHDIGKLGGRNHAHRGEIMAGRALGRLGFDKRTVELVRFLIREHLLMSHISQRRDIDDEETVGDFVERVGSANRLRMLTLLTFADLMALSEGALTEWKKTLLRELYRRALMLIEKGYEQHTASRRHGIDAIAEALAGEFPPDTVRAHLRLLPEQYLRVTSRSAIRQHIRGIGLMKRRGVWASFRRAGDVTLLTVIADDYPRALSDICGAITASGINITGARIFTRNDGVIIDTFLVTDGEGNGAIPPEIQRAFKRNIADVVGGSTDAARLIATYLRRWRRKKRNVVFAPPRVRIHNDVSSRYTVIDVFAIDYTGLLYDITSVLASFEIDIHTARIGTDEDQVADAFYVRTGAGEKIEDEMEMQALERAIVERLKKAYE